MGELSNTTINGVSYDFKDAGAARQSHSHTKSQITDFPTSMPASDVSAWAKASSKPSYTQDEVGDGNTYKRVTSTEKNTWNSKGTYSKPSGGIPKSDLASAVQTLLDGIPSPPSGFTPFDMLPGSQIDEHASEMDYNLGFVNYGSIVFIDAAVYLYEAKDIHIILFDINPDTSNPYPDWFPLSPLSGFLTIPVYDDHGQVLSGCYMSFYADSSIFKGTLHLDGTAIAEADGVFTTTVYLGKKPW